MITETEATDRFDVRTPVAFDFTAGEVSAYTEGDCWILAIEVNRRLGWPLAVIAGSDGLSASPWAHMLLQLPNGHLVDIEGVHCDEEVLGRRWLAELTRQRCDGTPRVYVLDGDGGYDDATAGARRTVEHLVEGFERRFQHLHPVEELVHRFLDAVAGAAAAQGASQLDGAQPDGSGLIPHQPTGQ